jgi:cytokinesis protein
MDSIFGRIKNRPPRQPSVSSQDLDQRSVPYDKLGPSPRSPVSVSSVSQGLRGTSIISAPATNPSLTTDGTEFNVFAAVPPKAEGEGMYSENPEESNRPHSPSNSISTTDSSTLYPDSHPSSSLANGSRTYTPDLRHVRRSEASVASQARSPTLADFGQYLSFSGSSSPFRSGGTARQSSATSRTDVHRGSKYAAPSIDSAGHFSFYHHHRHGPQDDFNFPKPENDEDIEALFEKVKRTRDLGDMPNLPIEQKWHIVYNDEHIRWKEEKNREEQTRKQNESGQPPSIAENTPEWYIKKFLDKTITAKHVSSLSVSLRSKELRLYL